MAERLSGCIPRFGGDLRSGSTGAVGGVLIRCHPRAERRSRLLARPLPSYRSRATAHERKNGIGMNDVALTQVALFLGAAVVAAPLAKLLRVGNVLGYLLVGVLIGPEVLGRFGLV